jgi:hypothetical protein
VAVASGVAGEVSSGAVVGSLVGSGVLVGSAVGVEVGGAVVVDVGVGVGVGPESFFFSSVPESFVVDFESDPTK